MFTQKFLENVVDGLTPVQKNVKEDAIVMKLHLDAKVENVDYVAWDYNEDWLPGWCQLATAGCKIGPANSGHMVFYSPNSCYDSLGSGKQCLTNMYTRILGKCDGWAKTNQKITKENVTITKLHQDALVDYASMLFGITTVIRYQAGVNLLLMGVLQGVPTQDSSCTKNVSMDAPSREAQFNQKKTRTLIYHKGDTAFEICY